MTSQQQLQALERFSRADETRKFFGAVNAEGYQPKLDMCRNQQNELLTAKEEIMNRWVEYFEGLINIPPHYAKTTEAESIVLQAEEEGMDISKTEYMLMCCRIEEVLSN